MRLIVIGALLVVAALGAVYMLADTFVRPPVTEPAPTSPPSVESARVVWVNDGDTMVVSPVDGAYAGREQRVRLIGIDAPEVRPVPQCWAGESTKALLKLAPRGSIVTLAFDTQKFDDYRRQLRYVWNAQGVLVNESQLAGGNAFFLRVWPNVAYEKDFREQADRARAAKRGLWGGCADPRPPVHGPNSAPPPSTGTPHARP
ncbi:thermonuclease family protein [Nonomuraea sp. NPDC050790]|uniref:thermonuclease family protein n=1 Tax=Nonomuraea sp. NPDC050790 TaxID=3364371 RepID=UPI0037AC1978